MNERVIASWPLAGLSVTTTTGTRVVFVAPDDNGGDGDDDGSGVREPCRPRPGPPSLSATLPAPS